MGTDKVTVEQMKSPKLTNFNTRLKLFETKKVKAPEKKADSFYSSPEWRELMKQIFKERGRRCEDPQCKTPRNVWGKLYGDHIVELKDGGAPLDKANIMIRCAPCHGIKTLEERRKRGQSSLAGFA
jgi:5-methylcytosine-specific restriction protein A